MLYSYVPKATKLPVDFLWHFFYAFANVCPEILGLSFSFVAVSIDVGPTHISSRFGVCFSSLGENEWRSWQLPLSYHLKLCLKFLDDDGPILDEKRSLFSPASGVIGEPWPYTSKYLPKTWRGFIFGPYAHFLIMKFFSKNLKFFFDFLKIQRGDPLDFKKIEIFFQFFWKKFHY